jgi:DNA-binding response OmpR family regulator
MRNRDHSILLADENDATRAFLTSNLEADGYRVKAADDRAKAIALLSVDQPDLIIADINGQTLELLDAIRSGNGLAGHLDPDTPMIVLSERPDDLHRIRVLERGGDDIIAKPFSYPELRARVAAVLRRAERSRHARQLRVASLTIDLTAMRPRRLAAASRDRTSAMSPKDQPRSRPVPTQRTTMSCHAGGDGHTAQPTCCRQPSATTT